MLERNSLLVLNQTDSRLHLRQDRMAGSALVGNNLAGCADVLAVMATKAAGSIKVAYIVGMRLPVHFHIREKG